MATTKKLSIRWYRRRQLCDQRANIDCQTTIIVQAIRKQQLQQQTLTRPFVQREAVKLRDYFVNVIPKRRCSRCNSWFKHWFYESAIGNIESINSFNYCTRSHSMLVCTMRSVNVQNKSSLSRCDENRFHTKGAYRSEENKTHKFRHFDFDSTGSGIVSFLIHPFNLSFVIVWPNGDKMRSHSHLRHRNVMKNNETYLNWTSDFQI